MDELEPLIGQLNAEVGELEQALRLREAEEGQKLALEAGRLKAAQARRARVKATLQKEGAALAGVEEQRAQLLARIDSWKGQTWRIGYGTAAMVTVTAALTSLPLQLMWLGSTWALAIGGAQAALFTALFFLIPQKR